MIKRIAVILVLAFFLFLFLSRVAGIDTPAELTGIHFFPLRPGAQDESGRKYIC